MDIQFTQEELAHMCTEARALHRGRRLPTRPYVSLPAYLIARILQRKQPRGSSIEIYQAYADDDTICSGFDIIWKTGARKVHEIVKTIPTEHDLEAMDKAEWQMWLDHCRACLDTGQGISCDAEPAFYRNGQEAHFGWQAYPPSLITHIIITHPDETETHEYLFPEKVQNRAAAYLAALSALEANHPDHEKYPVGVSGRGYSITLFPLPPCTCTSG